MKLEDNQNQKLKKLGCENILSLATIAPNGYEDLRIYERVIKSAQLIDATVEHISRTPKTLQITLYAHNLGFKVQAVIFAPKPYMIREFVIGERNYYYAKVEFSAGVAQISHPKKVTQIGSIVAKYKSVLRSDIMSKFMREMITKENLLSFNLPQMIVNELLNIHFPKKSPPFENGSWSEKALHALKFTELYDYMNRPSKKRHIFEAKYSCHGEYESWSKTLPFKLTDEQINAIEDIINDLSKKSSAKRMIVGDVGCGKTMVILASVLIARPHRSILMAPTTILASQLYEEAQKYLPFLRIVLINSDAKKSLNLEEFDFIIGTHALLYRELPDSALVMVDEQHRFGTAQRNLLAKLIESDHKRVHFLQFSATPIPRTQAMIDSAQIDVSLITTTPFEKNITTRIIRKKDFSTLLEHIKSELSQNHQVLIIYPLVEQSDAIKHQSIDEARGYWEEKFEDVYVTHGRDKNKEEVLVEFREKGTILIATTVVEVGISLPRLTTIVIVGAERLGLSSLHQLRGRVSRNGLKGYCYLYTNLNESERLSEFCKRDNGFDIAALDLKFRQSGDLLSGKNQSGKKFIWLDMGEDEEIVKEVKRSLTP